VPALDFQQRAGVLAAIRTGLVTAFGAAFAAELDARLRKEALETSDEVLVGELSQEIV
jgi:hypothetical protein